jgi:hypothetical protein
LHLVRDAAEGDDGPVLKFKHSRLRFIPWLVIGGICFADAIESHSGADKLNLCLAN